MSMQKFFTKAFIFICAICAVYAVSCFLGSSEAAGKKSRHRAKFSTPLETGNREPSTASLAADECGISGFVLDYKEKTEVANAKLQARLRNGRQKLLTEYSEDDGFYCFFQE
ncbi:MAG: hypothetical protein HZA01_12060 [Nitrospinae bacterium]|nr:hypothetical protein [Nitrospinota bacterium]